MKNDNKFRCSRLTGLAGGGCCCCRGSAVVGLAVVVLTGVVAVAVGAAAVVALSASAHPDMVIPVLVLAEGAAVASHATPAASLSGQPPAVPASLRERSLCYTDL